MDPDLILIVGFFLIAIVLTGSFALLLPISRQLAKFLEFRSRDKVGPSNVEAEMRDLRATVENLERQLSSLIDRQELVEKVLDARESDLPRRSR